jgi:hypothetical protein
MMTEKLPQIGPTAKHKNNKRYSVPGNPVDPHMNSKMAGNTHNITLQYWAKICTKRWDSPEKNHVMKTILTESLIVSLTELFQEKR